MASCRSKHSKILLGSDSQAAKLEVSHLMSMESKTNVSVYTASIIWNQHLAARGLTEKTCLNKSGESVKTSCHVVTGVSLAFSTFKKQSDLIGNHEGTTYPASPLQMPVILFWLFSLKNIRSEAGQATSCIYRGKMKYKKEGVEVEIMQIW